MATQPQIDYRVVSLSLPQQEFAMLEQLAQSAHTSVPEYVLQLVREKARPRRTPEEIQTIIRAFREEVQAANPDNRDLLAELLEERRREAAL